MSDEVYEDADAPESFVMNVTPGDTGIDLSTVTAAVFKVRKATGAKVTWTATRSNQTTTTLRLTHEFDAADVDAKGPYVAYALLTIPSGSVKTSRVRFTVKGEFEV